jgi:hypothetical protein
MGGEVASELLVRASATAGLGIGHAVELSVRPGDIVMLKG